jgi:hypothetical protein
MLSVQLSMKTKKPFEESAENRKALSKLVRDRKKNIQFAIDRLKGMKKKKARS